MGYDSFGLPAENAAIKEGGHPREITERNIVDIRARCSGSAGRSTGRASSRPHEPEYYRWTQWLFLRFFERGLAYRKGAPVKWCPNDQTVLANEQVIDGHCERCGADGRVAQLMEQWFFRITDYADALLDDLETRRLARATKTIQRNWIGRSRGRRDRLPDRGAGRGHPGLHDAAGHAVRRDVLRARARAPARRVASSTPTRSRDYVRHTAAKKTEERAAAEEKTGVFTGLLRDRTR